MQSTKTSPNTYKEDTKIVNAITSSNSFMFDEMSHEEIWYEYMTHPSPAIRDKALEELLFLHNKALAEIARYVHKAHQVVGHFEDYMEYARCEAISAYNRYNPDKNIKLLTYTYVCVKKRLFTISDEITLIKKRSGQRDFRSYFKGDFDSRPEKKLAFEEKCKSTLDNEKKRKKKETEMNVLNAQVISYDSYVTNDEGDVIEKRFDSVFQPFCQEPRLEKIDWSNAVNKMSSTQKKVYKMHFVEEYSVKEISEKIGISSNDIRKQIQSIKIYFRDVFPEYATN